MKQKRPHQTRMASGFTIMIGLALFFCNSITVLAIDPPGTSGDDLNNYSEPDALIPDEETNSPEKQKEISEVNLESGNSYSSYSGGGNRTASSTAESSSQEVYENSGNQDQASSSSRARASKSGGNRTGSNSGDASSEISGDNDNLNQNSSSFGSQGTVDESSNSDCSENNSWNPLNRDENPQKTGTSDKGDSNPETPAPDPTENKNEDSKDKLGSKDLEVGQNNDLIQTGGCKNNNVTANCPDSNEIVPPSKEQEKKNLRTRIEEKLGDAVTWGRNIVDRIMDQIRDGDKSIEEITTKDIRNAISNFIGDDIQIPPSIPGNSIDSSECGENGGGNGTPYSNRATDRVGAEPDAPFTVHGTFLDYEEKEQEQKTDDDVDSTVVAPPEKGDLPEADSVGDTAVGGEDPDEESETSSGGDECCCGGCRVTAQ